MPKLDSKINPDSEAFRDNAAAMQALVDDLREKVGVISQGGPERSRKRHLDKGKLLPRERVERLARSRHTVFGNRAIRRL